MIEERRGGTRHLRKPVVEVETEVITVTIRVTEQMRRALRAWAGGETGADATTEWLVREFVREQLDDLLEAVSRVH
jgi:hypothetical protein